MLLKRFPTAAEFAAHAESGCTVIPVCARILADTETPVSVLRRFHQAGAPVFLFESVEGGERWARYSFLGIRFHSEVKIFSNRIEKTGPHGTAVFPHDGDFRESLRAIIKAHTLAELADLPPFPAGLVGYLAYEAAGAFEDLPSHLPDTTPLGVFLIPDTLIVFDNQRHTLTCIALAFVDEKTPAETARALAGTRLDALLDALETPPPPETPPAHPECLDLVARTDPDVFRNSVKTLRNHILDGDMIQAVISQEFEGPAPEDPVALYRAIRYIAPSPYLFFISINGLTLVGSSPETMVRLEDGVATLRPIAGTRKRGETPSQDRALSDELLKDEKEKAEHLMLVDLGRNDLGRVAVTGSVQVTDLMRVERYSHVMHLVSSITAHLKPGLDALDLVAATFPAGTLSGAPKIRAMQRIFENETGPRGPYGGAVGYFSFNGNMDLAIVIRTAVIRENRLFLRVGAGIVADSDPEQERLETLAKAGSIRSALRLVSENRR